MTSTTTTTPTPDAVPTVAEVRDLYQLLVDVGHNRASWHVMHLGAPDPGEGRWMRLPAELPAAEQAEHALAAAAEVALLVAELNHAARRIAAYAAGQGAAADDVAAALRGEHSSTTVYQVASGVAA